MGGRMSYAATAQWWIEGQKLYTKSGFVENAKSFTSKIPQNLSGKSIAVTGANSGLGYAVSKELILRGAKVHMLCRNRERGAKAMETILTDNNGEGDVELHIVDVSDSTDIKRFATEFSNAGTKLTTLINNAGVVPETRMETKDGNEVSFATMAGGSFLLTSLLLPILNKEEHSRVINVSSAGMYTTGLDISNIQCDQDKKYDGVFAYAHAKRAQVILTDMFQTKYNAKTTATDSTAAKTTEGTGTTTFHSCHPGWSDTPGVRGPSMDWFNSRMEGNLRSPKEGADTVLWLAVGDDAVLDQTEVGGKFWFDRQVVREHMTMAWTREKEKDRVLLWNCLEEMFQYKSDL